MKARYLSLKPLIVWRPQPIDWAQIFGRSAPIRLEIGFGHGENLVKQAATHPQIDFVGIEMDWECATRALRRIAQTGFSNVRVCLGDARSLLTYRFEPSSLDAVVSLFPCPWPKERHAKHRLFDAPFLKLMQNRLKNGREAAIVTDSEEYADWIMEQAVACTIQASVKTTSAGYDTKYERKWLSEGARHFYKITIPSAQTEAVRREIALQGHTIHRFDPANFAPIDQTGPIAVLFKETLYDPAREKAMVRTVVIEDDLQQHVWIEIVRRDDGWRIRPSQGTGFMPTVGMQRALDLLKEAAERQF